MKKRIAVIGAGSAGLISVGSLCAHLDNSYEIVIIHNSNINSLGIGESTNSNFVEILELAMGFRFDADAEELDATKKFGTKFFNWRNDDLISPLIQGYYAVHFNTKKLKDFVFKRLSEKWPNKFHIIDGDVSNVESSADSVTVTVDDSQYTFDYIVDCRGFPTDFSEYTMSNCSLVNHCIVYDHKEFNSTNYTEHHATKNGWMFGVPLTTRMSYGYLYNDTITTKDEAIADMSDILNISSNDIEVRDYTFSPYFANKFLDNRILKNGNRALFFEPISATSIFMYVRIIDSFVKVLKGEYHELDLNQSTRNDLEDIQSVIRYYYHGGSVFDSKFWKKAKKQAIEQLKGDSKFYQLTCDLNRLVNEGKPYEHPGMIFGAYNWYVLDKIFNYNYFTGTDTFKFDLSRTSEEFNFIINRNKKEVTDYIHGRDQDTFKKRGYVHLKNIIDPLTVDLVTHYAINDYRMDFAPEGAHGEPAQVHGAHSKYADPLMESLMMQLLPVMENATGLTLYPTYSYFRVYKPGDILPPHTDRSSCEISTTVCFNFNYGDQQDSYSWPIFMEGTPYAMNPGDIIVYRGIDREHWREEFKAPENSWHVQAFFHYVDANGPHAEWKYDRREGIGFLHPETANAKGKNQQIPRDAVTGTAVIPQITHSKKYISNIN